MTALPFISQPALVALAIFAAWWIAAGLVAVLFCWSGRHRDDVFRYDTAPTGDRRRQEGTR